MNKDLITVALNEFAGKAPEDMGRLIRNPSQQDTGFDLQNRFIQACVGLFTLATKRHRLNVAAHDGISAGSLLHRGVPD
jgi:hypothetical protein